MRLEAGGGVALLMSLNGLFAFWRTKPPVSLWSRTWVRSRREILTFVPQKTKILI